MGDLTVLSPVGLCSLLSSRSDKYEQDKMVRIPLLPVCSSTSHMQFSCTVVLTEAQKHFAISKDSLSFRIKENYLSSPRETDLW